MSFRIKALWLGVLFVLFVAGGCASRPNLNQEMGLVGTPRPVKVDEARILFGPAPAPITLVEYGDFQCPACSVGYERMMQLEKKYGDKIRFIHKEVPLEHIHPLARTASEIFEALMISDKKKAREFYNIVYLTQGQWRSEKDLWLLAQKTTASVEELKKIIKQGEVSRRIQEDLNEHEKRGFRGTPAYVINGYDFYGVQDYDTLSRFIDGELAKAKK